MRSRTVVLFSVDAGPVPPRRYPARARSRRDILNLAHAAVFMPACFVALTLVASLHLHVAAALPLAVLAAGLLGVLLERVAFRPLRDRSDGNTSGLISSLAM